MTLIEPTEEEPLEPNTAVTPPIQNLSDNQSVVKAAAMLAVGNIASRVLGLAREIVKSNLFGTSPLLAAYTVAALVPMTLFNLITGGEMVSSSLVPVFSDYARKDRHAELWDVVSTFLSLAIIILLAIVGIVELLTPQVAWLAGARNFDDPTLMPVTIDMMRLAAPAVLFLSAASVITGVLYALKRFTLPAFTGAVFNGTIVIVALLRPEHIDSLVWGLLLGSLLQIVLQLPALRDGRFRFQLNWHHPAVRRIIILYTPIVAGLVINQIAIWISYNLAITTGDNAVTYMTYATTLYQFPLGLVVTALSMATLPTLSQMATAYREAKDTKQPDAPDKLHDYKSTLSGGIRLALTLILPATAGLFALATPIIGLLLEHGQFTPQDTAVTAQVLRYYLFGLPFAAIDQMLVFASYARKDTWRPALAGVVSIAIYTVTAALLLNPLGLLSLMAADAAKHVVHTLIMLWLLQRHLNGLPGYKIGITLGKSLLAAIITGLAAYAAASLAALLPIVGFLQKLVVVGAGSTAGSVLFICMALLLNMQEAKSMGKMVINRLRR